MLFNSADFAVFLPIVFILYWFAFQKNLKAQNLFVLVASYIFYGWWDWRFLSLLLISTLVDYGVGLALRNEANQSRRKIFLSISIIANLGLLATFKYCNFFIDNFIAAFSCFGVAFSHPALEIVLPVGISFYTFQTLSYGIDVYRRNIEPTDDFIAFAAFVTFFPQLVAGPIERASNLLPQFFKARSFSYGDAVDGTRQILWGLLKKLVVADNCAEHVNTIFRHSADYSGSTIVLGAVLFAIQIYCDFSGYSDIAIGTARLFGFQLMRNFAFPYFSRDIAEFWRRWHISLSTWFRDYLYIPLGGSRGSAYLKVRNVFIVFLVSGFWHGANWTYVVWGGLNALYFLPLLLRKSNRQHLDSVAAGRYLPSLREAGAVALTFGLTVVAWIFFRSRDMDQAIQCLTQIASPSLFTIPVFPNMMGAFWVVLLVVAFMVVEWFGREEPYALRLASQIQSVRARRMCYYAVALVILLCGRYTNNEFIYFQF